jgi:hypothetical protein
VREARIKREGDWEAMERAIEDPMLSGDTPVMSTVGSESQWSTLVNWGKQTVPPTDLVSKCLCNCQASSLLVPLGVC